MKIVEMGIWALLVISIVELSGDGTRGARGGGVEAGGHFNQILPVG